MLVLGTLIGNHFLAFRRPHIHFHLFLCLLHILASSSLVRLTTGRYILYELPL